MTLVAVANNTYVNPDHVVAVFRYEDSCKVHLVTVEEVLIWNEDSESEANSRVKRIINKILDAENNVLL